MPPSREIPQHRKFALPFSLATPNPNSDTSLVRPFALIRRDPALLAAELAWRWSFGLGSLAVLFLVFRRIQQALTLSGADDLSRSHAGYLDRAQALAGVIGGAAPLVGSVALWALLALAVLWIAAATLGRGTITHVVVRTLAEQAGNTIAPRFSWSAMAAAHFARAFTLIVPLIGYLLGALASSSVLRADAARANEPQASAVLGAMALFCTVFLAVLAVWSVLHFVVALAPIFIVGDGIVSDKVVRDKAVRGAVVRDDVVGNGRSALDAISDAAMFTRRHWRALAAQAAQNAALRSIGAVALSAAALLVWTALSPRAPVAAFLLLAVLGLIYIVLSDFLLLARTIAYIQIVEAKQGSKPR